MFKSYMRFVFAAVIMLFGSAQADAAGLCCQLSSGVQESLAGVAAPASGDYSIQLNYSFSHMDEFRDGTVKRSLDELKLLNQQGRSPYSILPVSMDMIKYTLTAGYGFSPKIKAFISVPFIRNTMDMTRNMGMGMWMNMTMEPVSGLGDIVAMGLYRLYTDREIKPSDALTLGFGVKTASGSFTETSSSGNLVHAHMQPGTGSWDPLVSLMYSKMTGSFLLQSDATYQYSTRNRNGYEFGDSLAANFSARYAVAREFNVTAAFTYLHVGSASDQDGKYTNPSSLMDDQRNTGGNSVWFSPGIQVLPLGNAMLDLKVQLPLWERVNGTQLASSYRALAGLSYQF